MKLIFLLLLSTLLVNYAHACSDDPQFLFDNKRWGHCRWVSQKAAKRCLLTDSLGRKVDQMCRNTCNNCSECKDDASYVFKSHPRQKLKNCSWVGKSRRHRNRRCSKKDRNGNKVSDKCRKSCEICSVDKENAGGVKEIGVACKLNNECSTNICSNSLGVCIKDFLCKSLDLDKNKGTAYDKDTIIMVFVGSAFTNKNDFSNTVTTVYQEIKSEEMFNDSGAKYRAFYVDLLAGGFCDYGCDGIDRLLCCDVSTARILADYCFPERSTLQTIVIHNDEKYGGAGYPDDNMAVISKNSVGPRLALHELGHSLFEFGDEYKYGPATAATKANCDVKGCPKWADLNDSVEEDLCKLRACDGGRYYAGRNSFMRNMYMPVGLVNLRFTCCTYQALTKSMPSYCHQFKEIGEGLLNYCRKNDYQGYGGEAVYTRRKNRELGMDTKYATNGVSLGHRHKIVYEPVIVKLDLESQDFKIVSNSTHSSSSISTMFRHHHVHGDFQDIGEVKETGVHSIVYTVQVEFESGTTQEFLFGDVTSLIVPPSDPFEDTNGDENEALHYAERKEVQIVVERSKGDITRIDMKRMKL